MVGPNGSGKSNISDAVLWVLGERNAKHLRGQAMEDVIFAGSSARKSVGIAEVDLVLDNSDGTLPVDFDEVAVTRRMYRSGESEYLINGVVARRMDVLDILHDSGLGTGTHSIISQGSLDSILQSKPEDRRALIEEAAGVLKHKQRKAKSERKLAAMDAPGPREGRGRRGGTSAGCPLERKAARARTYQGLADELADLSLSAVDDLHTLRRGGTTRSRASGRWKLSWRRSAPPSPRPKAAAEHRRRSAARAWTRESWPAGTCASSAVERFDGATLLLHEKRRAAQSYEAELRVTLEANAAKPRRPKPSAQAVSSWPRCSATASRPTRTWRAWPPAVRKRAEAPLARARGRGAGAREARRRAQEQARRELAETQEALTSGLAHVKLIEGHGKELELQLERANGGRGSRRPRRRPAGARGARRGRGPRAPAWARRWARARRRAARWTSATRHRFWHPRSRGSKRSSARQPQARRALGLWIMLDLDVNLAPIAHVVRASARLRGARGAAAGGGRRRCWWTRRAGKRCGGGAARDEQGGWCSCRARARRAARALRAKAAAAGSGARSSTSWRTRTGAAAVEALLGDVAVCDARRRGVRRMRAGRKACVS
ncbi:MAG: hypothetical protein ACLTMP_12340 [Eggerthella lenta]